MKTSGQRSTGYVYLMSGNNRETGRVLPGKFCPHVNILLTINMSACTCSLVVRWVSSDPDTNKYEKSQF